MDTSSSTTFTFSRASQQLFVTQEEQIREGRAAAAEAAAAAAEAAAAAQHSTHSRQWKIQR